MTRSNRKTPNIAIPRPSASVLLLRDGKDGIEVLMMRRAKSMGFAAGAIAFPGGGLEPDKDGTPEVSNDVAYRQCALRETAEETGITLPGPDALRLYARWITPAFIPKRFDTWFYLAALPAGETPIMASREMDDLWFDRPATLLEQHIDNIMLPQQMSLHGLLPFATVAEAMTAGGDQSGTALEPKIVDIDGQQRLEIPASFGGGHMPVPRFLKRS